MSFVKWKTQFSVFFCRCTIADLQKFAPKFRLKYHVRVQLPLKVPKWCAQYHVDVWVDVRPHLRWFEVRFLVLCTFWVMQVLTKPHITAISLRCSKLDYKLHVTTWMCALTLSTTMTLTALHSRNSGAFLVSMSHGVPLKFLKNIISIFFHMTQEINSTHKSKCTTPVFFFRCPPKLSLYLWKCTVLSPNKPPHCERRYKALWVWEFPWSKKLPDPIFVAFKVCVIFWTENFPVSKCGCRQSEHCAQCSAN